MKNDTPIHVLFSVYCELYHFIVNDLGELMNSITGIFKIFNNKIATKKTVENFLFVCLFNVLPFRYLPHVKVLKIVELNKHNFQLLFARKWSTHNFSYSAH